MLPSTSQANDSLRITGTTTGSVSNTNGADLQDVSTCRDNDSGLAMEYPRVISCAVAVYTQWPFAMKDGVCRGANRALQADAREFCPVACKLGCGITVTPTANPTVNPTVPTKYPTLTPSWNSPTMWWGA